MVAPVSAPDFVSLKGRLSGWERDYKLWPLTEVTMREYDEAAEAWICVRGPMLGDRLDLAWGMKLLMDRQLEERP